ncbi:MAG: carotenoid biosynthesis protein [Chthoniobacterales bacterium]
MRTETLHRWLWRTFLFWTLVEGVVLTFDIGAAQAKNGAPSGLQSTCIALLRATDAIWIVLAAAFVYIDLIRREGLPVARRAAIAILLGSGLVAGLGAKTGFPFGPFIFTGQMGAKIAGVPFAVPLLWMVILVASRYTVLHFWEHARRWQIAVGTGLLAVATDASLEWIAWKIRAWWLWYFPLANTPNWPPLQNFPSWFCLAALLAWFAFPASRPVGRHIQPVILLGLLNLVFWVTLAVRWPR